MKVVMIGTGYVGLVSGTCFAEMDHDVTCIDISEEKIRLLKDGKSPIYEPGLNDMLERNIKAGRLNFALNDYSSVKDADCVFLAVGTPSGDDGQANLQYLFDAAKTVAEHAKDGGIIVIKSTVPVGTCNKVREIVEQSTSKKISIVNNPEFLKEGAAIEDFMKPDRIVIGYKEESAADAIEELYRPLMLQGHPIYKMSNLSAEMTKYAANCFLATKISFINEIAKLCDATDADINEVRKGITSDRRIGHHFLYPGPGYGGSCFPKDVKALIHTAKEHGMNLSVVEAAETVNDKQKFLMADKIKKHFNGDVKGKKIAFWGVAFKPNTDDVRETPAIYAARELIKGGATVNFFDPVASDNYAALMTDYAASMTKFDDKYEALENADALFLVTEWNEFRAPDYNKVKEKMNSAVIFDGRNIYPTDDVLEHGFQYYAIGKYIPKA